MKLKDFIEKLKSIKPELQNTDIYVVAQNGLKLEPQIKFLLKDGTSFDKTKENVEAILLSY